jgi:hypothetical protein
LYTRFSKDSFAYPRGGLLEIEPCRHDPAGCHSAGLQEDRLGRRRASVDADGDYEIISRNASTRRPICPVSDVE